MFIEPTITRVPLGLILWVHVAWYKSCVALLRSVSDYETNPVRSLGVSSTYTEQSGGAASAVWPTFFSIGLFPIKLARFSVPRLK